MPYVLKQLLGDPFLGIREAGLEFLAARPPSQRAGYGGMVELFPVLGDALLPAGTRLKALRVITRHCGVPDALGSARVVGASLQVPQLQPELLRFLATGLSMAEALASFPQLGEVVFSGGPRSRAAVFKAFGGSLDAAGLCTLLEKGPEAACLALVEEQRAALQGVTLQQIKQEVLCVSSEARAIRLCQACGALFPGEQRCLGALVPRFPACAFHLPETAGLEDELRAAGLWDIFSAPEAYGSLLLGRGSYGELLRWAPRFLPPREEMEVFFLRLRREEQRDAPQSRVALDKLRAALCFLLRLKEAGAARFHQLSSMEEALQESLAGMQSAPPAIEDTQAQRLTPDQIGTLETRAREALGLAEVSALLLRAFPGRLQQSSDIARQVFSLFMGFFSTAYGVKYVLYENADHNPDALEDYLPTIEQIDEAERALVLNLSTHPSMALAAAWADVPVCRRVATSILKGLAVEKVSDAIIEGLRNVEQIQTPELRGAELREDAGDFLRRHFNKKLPKDVRQQWARVIAWGLQHGLPDLARVVPAAQDVPDGQGGSEAE